MNITNVAQNNGSDVTLVRKYKVRYQCPECNKRGRMEVEIKGLGLRNFTVNKVTCDHSFVFHVDQNGKIRGYLMLDEPPAETDINLYIDEINEQILNINSLKTLIERDIISYDNFYLILFNYFVKGNVLFLIDKTDNENFELLYMTLRNVLSDEILMENTVYSYYSHYRKKLNSVTDVKTLRFHLVVEVSSKLGVSTQFYLNDKELNASTQDITFKKIFETISQDNLQLITSTFKKIEELSLEVYDQFDGSPSSVVKKIIKKNNLVKATELNEMYIFELINYKIRFIHTQLQNKTILKENLSENYLSCINRIEDNNFVVIQKEKELKKINSHISNAL